MFACNLYNFHSGTLNLFHSLSSPCPTQCRSMSTSSSVQVFRQRRYRCALLIDFKLLFNQIFDRKLSFFVCLSSSPFIHRSSLPAALKCKNHRNNQKNVKRHNIRKQTPTFMAQIIVCRECHRNGNKTIKLSTHKFIHENVFVFFRSVFSPVLFVADVNGEGRKSHRRAGARWDEEEKRNDIFWIVFARRFEYLVCWIYSFIHNFKSARACASPKRQEKRMKSRI